MTRLLYAALAFSSLAACTADNGDEGLYLSKILAPNDSCSYNGDPAAPYLASGTYTIGARSPYFAIVQIQSRLELPTGLQEEARTVQMRGARVELSFADPEEDPGTIDARYLKFRSLFAAPVRPGGITDAGFDLIPVEVSQGLAAQVAANDRPSQMLATIELYGDLAGSEVVSQEYVFPITITDLRNVVGTCPLPAGSMPGVGNVCAPYQEGSIDCCTDGADVVCPATVAPGA